MIDKFKYFNDTYTSTKVGVFGLSKSLQTLYILETFKNIETHMLVVVDNNSDINNLYNELICYSDKVLTFPMDSVAIADVDAISPEFMQERFDTLVKLKANQYRYIVIASLEGSLHPLLSSELYDSNMIKFEVGTEIEAASIIQFLNDNLYERVDVVSQTGEYAFRGHVLDIYLEDKENPVRIEFWGDEVDSIREFDLESQRTVEKIEQVILYPNPDCQLSGNTSTIADYVSGYNVVVDFPQIINRYDQLEYSKTFTDIFDLHLFSLDSDCDIELKKVYYSSGQVPSFSNNYKELAKYIEYKLKNKWLVVITLDTKNQLEEVKLHLNMDSKVVDSILDVDYSKVNLMCKRINSSIEFDDAKICVITSSDIYSKKTITKKYLNKFKFTQKIKAGEQLVCGDCIVHELHGIGRYAGIKPITSNGITRDFFVIEYQGDDKLYVPIEQVDEIQKYSSNSDFVPRINKLGGVEWEKTKRRIAGRMEDIANKLLEIYAKRESAVGFACSEDSVDALVFEQEFEFEETRDQIRAIAEIKTDMEKKRPMDRLLCGDVGFGKTEVAFRAAFKAMDNNKQVAYLCPTTILSMQQYEEAVKRFINVPINMALLNRYTSLQKRREILEKLRDGRIDLVFGTHSLLNEKIEYKDLGLLIVDEEQRFGVEHKEKIKEIKAEVDVLTLSATPIPRTLQMSLLGIRDLSTIDTAPINRFPVQTYVMSYNERVIRDAIKTEYSRGGQVFVLCNTIAKHNLIKRLVKSFDENLIIESANGKMGREAMEDVFYRFSNHEVDVLVATTIIESGINVPNANTLIILGADRFGLAQLYQIRGRVGRGNNIAYAYLMYDQNKILTTQAHSRLEAIKNFTSLGSGFKIASRDLAIRGAGDILGAEQAGFIDTVGVELYMKMLKSVVSKKQEQVEEKSTVKIPLVKYSNHIPDEYVNNDDVKLRIHKRIQEIDSVESYHEIKEEISDVYGKVPKEVKEYMDDVLFNITIRSSHITKVEEKDNIVSAYLDIDNIDGERVLEVVNNVGRHFRVLNKISTVYLTIDKRECKNWKGELLKYIYLYDKM